MTDGDERCGCLAAVADRIVHHGSDPIHHRDSGGAQQVRGIERFGLGRIPENGVVASHTGIRGDADVPATFKFEVTKPIGRITLTPVK